MRSKRYRPQIKLSISDMAYVFEQLDIDTPIKSLAIDLNVHRTTLARWIIRAEKFGFEAWGEHAKA